MQAICQHHAPFSVGVHDFDRLARHRRDHVSWAIGFAGGHILRRADHTDHLDLGLEQGNRAHRAQHRRAAGHVVLHLLHAFGGLDRDAARVEGDGLADQAEDRAVSRCTLRLVGGHDQRRRLFGTLCYCPERAHLQLMQLLGGIDLTLQADFFGHLGGTFAKNRRRQHIAGLVDQRTRPVLRFGEDGSFDKSELPRWICRRRCRGLARGCGGDSRSGLCGRSGRCRDRSRQRWRLRSLARMHGPGGSSSESGTAMVISRMVRGLAKRTAVPAARRNVMDVHFVRLCPGRPGAVASRSARRASGAAASRWRWL